MNWGTRGVCSPEPVDYWSQGYRRFGNYLSALLMVSLDWSMNVAVLILVLSVEARIPGCAFGPGTL
jgi:hypothetical protein